MNKKFKRRFVAFLFLVFIFFSHAFSEMLFSLKKKLTSKKFIYIILLIFILPVLVLTSFQEVRAASDNASLQYVWNQSCTSNDETCWIPWIADNTGKPKVDLNLLNITSQNISVSDSLLADFIFPEASSIIALLGGLIGINTTSPTHTLTVEGDLNVTGQTFFNSLNLSGVTFSQGNITTDQDLIVEGRIYGGSPVDIVNGLNIVSGTIQMPDGSIMDTAPNNNSYNYVYNGTDFVGMKATSDGRVRFDINSLSAEKSLDNFTGSDSILVDYIYPNSLTTINLENITILKDLRVLGNSYLGSFQIQDDLIIGSNNISSTWIGIGTLTPAQTLNIIGAINITGDMFLSTSSLSSCSGKLITSADGNITCGTDAAGSGMDYANIAMLNSTSDQTFVGNVSFADNLTVDGSTFYVDASSNNVGIGTTTPTGKLSVTGSIVKNVCSANSYTNFDVSGCGIVDMNMDGTYTGFSGGVTGQVLHVIQYANGAEFEHNAANGTQKFLTKDSQTATLGSATYGMGSMVFDGNFWHLDFT